MRAVRSVRLGKQQRMFTALPVIALLYQAAIELMNFEEEVTRCPKKRGKRSQKSGRNSLAARAQVRWLCSLQGIEPNAATTAIEGAARPKHEFGAANDGASLLESPLVCLLHSRPVVRVVAATGRKGCGDGCDEETVCKAEEIERLVADMGRDHLGRTPSRFTVLPDRRAHPRCSPRSCVWPRN